MYDYNCPDCNEAKLQTDKNARKINEVIDEVNTLIDVYNGTVEFIKEKANEEVKEIAKIKVNEVIGDLRTEVDNIKIVQGVNVEDFKRLDNETTDVGRINRAIQFAKENNINIVNFAPLTYDVTDGTIICDWKVDLVGYGGVNSTTFDKRGTTVLNAYNSTTEEPVIKYSVNKGSYIMGVRFSNFCIIGCNNWYQEDVKQWSNRTAIHLENVAREYKLEDISIIGFKKHAIKGVNLWDGSAFGLSISFCGTDGLYPAVYFTGDRENSNAGHWYGIHMEHVPYMIKFDSGTRHMQITDSKFEVGEQKALNSYIQIDKSCQEILFKGNQFVNNNYSDVATSLYPHMFKINNRHTVFDNNMFSSPTPTGALWIDASESNGIKIVNNNFNFMACLDYAIKLKDNSQVHNNTFWINTHVNTGRKRGLYVDGWFNIITNNFVRSEVTTDSPTEGAIFSCSSSSTNNIFSNRFQNGFKSFMKYNVPNSNNKIVPMYSSAGVISDNRGKPEMSIEYDIFYVENTQTVYINDFIHHKYINKKITLIGKEEYTKIVNGTGIKTKDGNTINMTKGKIVKFIYCDVGDGYQWVEV